MKVITIGRDPSCDIVINDPQISRRHAIVRVSDTGKIEIVDLSSNGTSVNGNPLRKNVPYPVTRKNQVTFAGVSKLNWSDIPDPAKLYRWIGLGLLGLIAAAIIITLIVRAIGSSDEIVDPPIPAPIEQTQGTDTSTTDAEKDSTTTNASQDDKTSTNSSESTNNSYNHLLKSSETKANSSTTTDVKTTSSSANTTNSTVKSTSNSANVSTSSGKKGSKGNTNVKTKDKTTTGTTNGGSTNGSSNEEKKSTGGKKDRKG